MNRLVRMLRSRFRSLFHRDAVEAELDRELQYHIEQQIAELVARGMDRPTARNEALRIFGGVEATKDAARDARGTARLESLVRDVRYAIRSLKSRPAFTVTVVIMLAVGIGANGAIFTLVDALLLRSLPVSHPEQLVIVGDPAAVYASNYGTPTTANVSFPLYQDVRDRNTVFADMYAAGRADNIDVTIGAGDDANIEHPHARFVTGNFFAVLGVPAFAGRVFTAQEDRMAGAAPVAVITYDYWQRRFSGSNAAIGSVMRVNNVAVTIVGVTPKRFTGDLVGQPLDMWLPLMMQPLILPDQAKIDDRRWSWLMMMGRLKSGVTLGKAREEVSTLEGNSIRDHLSGRELSEFAGELKRAPVQVVPGARGFSIRRDEYGRALWALLAAVGLVILVVSANVASLMLARTVARNREMTLRMTLGAGRGRLIQQVLVECLVLAIVSSVLGLVAAAWGARVLLASASASTPISIDTSLDGRVLAFTGVIALGCMLLFGVVPAFRATRVDLASSLRSHGRNLMGEARLGRLPFGRVLVGAQLALSMVLLTGGGLLTRSMQQLLSSDIGVDRDHIIVARVRTLQSTYVGARLAQLRRDLVDRIARIPGVDAATFADHGVFGGGASGSRVDVAGFVPRADSERFVALDHVGPNFFQAIGARLIRGRDLEPRDLETGRLGAVINESMAKRYFGSRDPVGGTVTVDSVTYTVIGVVRDFHASNVRKKPAREIYVAFHDPTIGETGSAKVFVHVHGNPANFVGPIRHAIEDVAPNLSTTVDQVTALVRETISADVLLMQVFLFFCAITLLLAALGLYGVTAYAAAQRTREFGLRVALGADPGRVAMMLLREAFQTAVIGMVVGVPAGVAATRLIHARLFGVGLIDLPSLSVAVAVLFATTVVASYVPAKRAAKVEPLEALRLE
ncbi:MAG TPA: ABC transporter permease [Gemmatimonadaceae bacterium]|nr:ABC transporter permease [Gemmatimonadaceae bacterium]